MSVHRDSLVPDVAFPVATSRVRVREVLKSADGLAKGAVLVVSQGAGSIEDDDGTLYTVPDETSSPLRIGGLYVLFLNRSNTGTDYEPSKGPSSIYLLVDGRASTQGVNLIPTGRAVDLLTTISALPTK
jgi:hypothetical protein